MQTFKTTNPKSIPPANPKLDIPEISDLENKPFQTLINKVTSTIINECKFNRKDRSKGSHIHQYRLNIEIHGVKYSFYLNLQPKEGKVKTYQAQQFINILQFIQDLNQNKQLFNTTSNNYEALIENFKDQLLDIDVNNISDIALTLHNLIQITTNTEKLTLNNLTLINETLTKLVETITANLNRLPPNQQERILKEFVILLYKSDLVNLNKAQSKYFTIAPSLLQTINQIFKKDIETLISIIGNEFNKEQNAVISIDNNYFIISTDLFGNILGLNRFAATTYPLDLEFNYQQTNDGVVKFCTLRSILQSQSDSISQLRQITPEFQIKTFNHNSIQAHYLPLDPPHIEIKDGKSITYSRQFIYTDPQLPTSLLQKYHKNNIPFDNSTITIANISLPKPPKTQSIVGCAKPTILIKKPDRENSDNTGDIATIFTTYKSDSNQELYHFIQGKVSIEFNQCIVETVDDINVIDLTKYKQLEQFKQLVNQFDWTQNHFYNKITELLNLNLDISTKLNTVKNLLNAGNLTNIKKFTLEIFEKMLKTIKQNPDIPVDNEFIFNILSSTTNSNKIKFITELNYHSSLEPSTKLVLMSYLGNIGTILVMIIEFTNKNDHISAKTWITRAFKLDHDKKHTANLYFNLIQITPDPILRKQYYETILTTPNAQPSILHSSYIYLLEILIGMTENNQDEILTLLKNLNIFLRNNQKYMLKINQDSNEQIQNAIFMLNVFLFVSEKLEPLREKNETLFTNFIPLLCNRGISEIHSKIYLIKINIKVRQYDIAASIANEVYTDLCGKYKNYPESANFMGWLKTVLITNSSIPELKNIVIHSYIPRLKNNIINVAKANSQLQNTEEEILSAALEHLNTQITLAQPQNEFEIQLTASRLYFYRPDPRNISQLQQELENNIKNPDFKKCSLNSQAAAIIILVGSSCINKAPKKKLQQLDNKYLTKIDPSKTPSELQINLNMLKLRLYILQNQEQNFNQLRSTIELDYMTQSCLLAYWFAEVDFYLENSSTITNAKRLAIDQVNSIKSRITEKAKTNNFVEKCDIFLARKIGIIEQSSITRVFKYIEKLRSENLSLDDEYFLMYEFSLWILEQLQDNTYQTRLNTAYAKLNISKTKNLKEYIEEIKKRCLEKFSDLGYRLMQIGIYLPKNYYN